MTRNTNGGVGEYWFPMRITGARNFAIFEHLPSGALVVFQTTLVPSGYLVVKRRDVRMVSVRVKFPSSTRPYIQFISILLQNFCGSRCIHHLLLAITHQHTPFWSAVWCEDEKMGSHLVRVSFNRCEGGDGAVAALAEWQWWDHATSYEGVE